jgi:ABC-type transport system involved in multi-copper enzyme maturation permease subunit
MSVLALAGAFLNEAARGRLFFLAAGLSLGLMALSFLVGPLSLGTDDKITRDMGLASLILSSAVTIFTGGVFLLSREIERKTIYLLIVRPISRVHYLLGKFLGLVMVAWGAFVICCAIFALVMAARGMTPDAALAQAALLTAMELVVLSALVVFFAALAPPVPAMLYAFGVFAAGHAMGDVAAVRDSLPGGVARELLDLARFMLPDLSRFDLRLLAVHGITAPSADVGWTCVYGLLYSAAVLALASAVFHRKEFK